MKLTPEQKDFLAYGEARGILKERKSLMRFTECLGECSDYHGEPRVMYGVEEAIREAWKWRRKCRAWQIPLYERICENCAHEETALYTKPCSECFRYPFTIPSENTRDKWEPRKDGK